MCCCNMQALLVINKSTHGAFGLTGMGIAFRDSAYPITKLGSQIRGGESFTPMPTHDNNSCITSNAH